MKLNLILGKAGSGKTTHIINEMILKESEGGGYIVFLVPEQYSLQAERDILSQKTATSINVLSFKRLAYRVFAETGLKSKTILDDVAMAMLLRKVLYNTELNYYNNTKITPGFIQKLSQTITELAQNGITPENILSAAGASSVGLAKKNQDIYNIYTAFLTYTAANFISTEQALDILAGKITHSSFLEGAYIYIDGFSSLTAQEYNVINQLLSHAENITMAITTDSPSISPTLQETDTYHEPKITLNKITQLAARKSISISPTYLSINHRHASNGELALLAENIFKYNYRYNAPTENVTLTPYTNSYQEVSATAAQILKMYRNGTPLGDIAILAPSTYHLAFGSIFADYNIPFFLDKTTDIMSHPLVTTVLSAIGTVAYNWLPEHVFGFLKAGLTNIPQSHIDILENYALAHNIRGYKWKLDKWTYTHDDTDLIHHIREQVLSAISPFRECFNHKTVKLKINALLSLLEQSGICDNVLDTEQSKENMLVYRKLANVLELMAEFIGDTDLTLQEFLSVLESGLAATTMGRVPEKLNSVIIADIDRSRLPNIKTLFVLGANEMRPAKTENLYTDTERAVINSFGVALPTTNTNLFKGNFAIYSYFAKPSHYLHISYSTNNYEGKSLAPSPIVSILKNKGISEIVQAPPVDILVAGHPQIEPLLSAETVDLLYGKEIHSSVSRLEQYARCPFSYFASYNLQAKPRPIFEMQHVDIGEIFHQILESFTYYTRNAGKNFADLNKKDIIEIVEETTQEMPQVKQAMFESYRGRYALQRIKRIAATSIWALCRHLDMGQFELHATEIDFGRTEPLTGIIVEIDGQHKFILKGRLDRIDIFHMNGDTYVKIIDYKSGDKKFSIEDVYHGMQLQLIVYLKAILQHGSKYFGTEGKILPGGVFYFKINDPILSVSGSPVDGVILEREILKTFTMSGLVLKDEKIINALKTATSAKINKDGTIRAGTHTADLKQFNDIMQNCENTLKEIGKKITAGNIAPFPFKKGSEEVCNYCNYKALCGFHEKNKKKVYNIVD